MTTPNDNVEFYFVPTSFCCQRVRLALEEKKIQYKATVVCSLDNEQNQPWFLKISPNGEVPVLRIGHKYILESEKIVNIIDKLPSGVPGKLVPDKETQEGKQVYFWRRSINEVEIPQLTFGITIFPEFSLDSPVGHSAPNAREVRDRFNSGILELEKLKAEHPELDEYYARKIAETMQMLGDFFDRERLLETLAALDQKMPQLETQAHAMVTRKSSSAGGFFLCGRSFTAADINLCILFGRFRTLGLLSRYVNRRQYPCLYAYWQHIQRRPSVKKVVIDSTYEMEKIVLLRKAYRFGKVVVVVVGVCGTAWLIHKLFFKN